MPTDPNSESNRSKKSSHYVDDATRFSAEDESQEEAEDFVLSDDNPADQTGPVGMLGEYLLLEPIGAGGMGQVFRAEHRTMNREVALKILSRRIATQPGLLEQFFAEIRAVARLMHPNIVTAFDAGSCDDVHYLVMELVNGSLLSGRIREQGPLSAAQAVSVLEQAAQALSYAHGVGIVHRDIKPSNMMLTKDGVLKILDFGLARFGAPSDSEQQPGVFMGTPEYMSPEQIESADAVDGRSDLYSLGATLYFLLTGKSMFTGEKMQVARAQLHQKPTPLFVARSDVDLRLDAVFQRLVAKKPADRYSSADELLETLEKLNLTSQPATGSSLQRGAFRLSKESPTSVVFDKSTLAKKSQVVAIDLGLMSTTTAYYDPNLGPQIAPQGDNNAQHLRNMLWSSGESIKIGNAVADLRASEPENVFHSVQRWIGARAIGRPFGGKNVPPEVMLAAILRHGLENTTKATETTASAIVTVPSSYDQMHRRAIRNACRIAGIELVQLLDKSLAAALSWLDVNSRLTQSGGQRAVDSKLLVVHLGGTGLDASVIHAQGSSAHQLGTCGHWKLGIQRWQHLLSEYFSQQLLERTGKSIRDDLSGATRLQRTIEMAMNRLTQTSKVDVRFDWEDESVRQTVTQEGLVKIAPELSKCLTESIQSACAIAKVDPSEIDQVLVAGAMMKMKPIQRVVEAAIPHAVAVQVLDKSEIARGAAIQGNSVSALSVNDGVALRAISSSAYDFALLTESREGRNPKPRIVLDKGTALPASSARTIRPSPGRPEKSQSGEKPSGEKPSGEKQAGAWMPVMQLIESTSLGSSNWHQLGRIDPQAVFPDRRSDDPLQLRMELDENGILESSLLWPDKHQQSRMPPTTDPELTDEEIKTWRDWLATTMLCS